MNVCLHTGHLREAATRYRNAAGVDHLFLTLYVRDDETLEDVPHKFRVERAALIAACEHLLTPGRQLTVRSRSRLVPIVRHGVVKAEVMAFEAQVIEFHNRAHGAEAVAPVETGTPSSQTDAAENPLARVMRELEA
jgi:hypothetical protein